jgi:hypothetical protein
LAIEQLKQRRRIGVHNDYIESPVLKADNHINNCIVKQIFSVPLFVNGTNNTDGLSPISFLASNK